MTPRPLTTPTEVERATRLGLFQSRHAIDPEYPAHSRFENFCRVCGVRVLPIKNGWRHYLPEASDLLMDFPDRSVVR